MHYLFFPLYGLYSIILQQFIPCIIHIFHHYLYIARRIDSFYVIAIHKHISFDIWFVAVLFTENMKMYLSSPICLFSIMQLGIFGKLTLDYFPMEITYLVTIILVVR